jgi:hypothetical protein
MELEARMALRLDLVQWSPLLILCDSLKVHVWCGFDVLSKGVLGFGGVGGPRRKHRALWLA